MSAGPTTLVRTVAAYYDEHPERWVFVLAAGAWATMLPHVLATTAACHQLSFWADWRSWLFMVMAMMVPLMAQSLRWVAERSFRARQGRAMVGYLVGYLAPWMVLGLGVAGLLGQAWAHDARLAPITFLLAAAWSATPVYLRLVGASHRTIPLAPRSWRADRDCLRFGLRQGVPCVASCALLMVGCTLTGHGFVAMLGGAALGASERLAWQTRPWIVPLGCGTLAAWYGAAAWQAGAFAA